MATMDEQLWARKNTYVLNILQKIVLWHFNQRIMLFREVLDFRISPIVDLEGLNWDEEKRNQ